MKDYSKMTDEELAEELEKRYGEDWDFVDLDPSDELAEEYVKRVSTGV